MMHKTCSINYGHLADLQKKTSYNWSTHKKNLSFDKISPHDFYFFPFFSICTCPVLGLAEKISLTANTNSNHCRDIYPEVIYAIYSKHRNYIIHQPVFQHSGLEKGQHKRTFSTSWKLSTSCAKHYAKHENKSSLKKNLLANDN